MFIRKGLIVLIAAFMSASLAIHVSAAEDSQSWILPTDLIRNDVDIDEYTTTWYRPWLANYHLTEPYEVAGFHKGGENGQATSAFAISPHHPELVLNGGDCWGINLSENGGNSWVNVFTGESFNAQAASDLIFHPDKDGLVYATISHDNSKPTLGDSGVYKSEDNGKTWRLVQPLKQKVRVCADKMVFSEKDENGNRVMYVATQLGDGAWYSTDDGDTFTFMGLKGVSAMQTSVQGQALVVATLEQGILYTDDYGKTWQSRNNGLEERDGVYQTTSVVTLPSDQTKWYCLNYGNLYESTDSGNSWKKLNGYQDWGRNESNVQSLIFSAPDETGHCILYLQFNQSVCPYQYSYDYGATWTLPKSLAENSIYSFGYGWAYCSMAVSPVDHDVMILSMDDEIYKSVDGGKSLQSISSGLSGHRILDWWFNPEDEYDWAVSCIDKGVLRSVDLGIHADYPAMTNEPSEGRHGLRDIGPTSYGIDRDPKNHDRFLISLGNWAIGGIWESTNGGRSFYRLDIDTMPIKDLRIRFNKNTPNVIYAGSMVSYDDGQTWVTPQYSIMGIYGPNNDIVYHASAANGILKSVDCGRTWEKLYSGSDFGSYRITVDYSKEDRLFIGTWGAGCIYIFDEGRIIKKSVESGFEKNVYGFLGCYEIAQDPKNPNHLVTCANDSFNPGKSSGIFESYDCGMSWSKVEGLPGLGDAWTVAFHPTLPRVFISTSSGTFSYEYEKYQKYKELNGGIYFDVENSPAKKEIEQLYKLGITNTYTDGYFKPQDLMKRETFVECVDNMMRLLDKSYGVSNITDQDFVDVTPYTRCYTHVKAAYEANLISVPYNFQFRPYDKITYNEAVKILSNIISHFNLGKGLNTQLAVNSLDKNIGLEYREDYYKLYFYNIIGSIKFNASDYATRENLAMMLYNTYKVIEEMS